MSSFAVTSFDTDAFDSDAFDLAPPVDVRVSWLAFDVGFDPVDVRVSWIAFDTVASPVDVRVSWLAFDNSGAPVEAPHASKTWHKLAVQRHSFADPVNSYWPVEMPVTDVLAPSVFRIWAQPSKDPSIAVAAARRHYPFQKEYV